MTEKVLLVDDEDKVLAGYARHFRKRFDFLTAGGGGQALEVLDREGPFAVIISDMRMPGMSGVDLLADVKCCAPNTVRMMLTGNSDQQTAMDAVNDGQIFRFLTKPCTPETLGKAVDAALEQYRLITAEQNLLSRTLAGSVKVLVDVLSLGHPEAFEKAGRTRIWARKVAAKMSIPNAWELDLAAMLWPIGQITLPLETIAKLRTREALTEAEWDALGRAPEIGAKLIGNIPRLQGVGKIVHFQNKAFDGTGFPNEWVVGNDIPVGARILKVLVDLAHLSARDKPGPAVFANLAKRTGLYDPVVLAAARSCLQGQNEDDEEDEARSHIVELRLHQLCAGDRLVSDICTGTGKLVLSGGYTLTVPLIQSLLNKRKIMGLREPVSVIRPPNYD